jgi:hypothetical protein
LSKCGVGALAGAKMRYGQPRAAVPHQDFAEVSTWYEKYFRDATLKRRVLRKDGQTDGQARRQAKKKAPRVIYPVGLSGDSGCA